jgi:uncharacterized protein YecT (DUF1311 family)
MADTQQTMTWCAQQDYQTADAALNQVYGQLRATLSTDDRTRLQQAERAWISFRDADCAAAAPVASGQDSLAMVTTQCETTATVARTKQLAYRLAPPEGDLSTGP